MYIRNAIRNALKSFIFVVKSRVYNRTLDFYSKW